jgi:D-glycero-D-manno-heptose 1,7-bisphosphate phosphatase
MMVIDEEGRVDDRHGDVRRPAVFLDRDGTIIEHVHYLADPARVRLLPDAAPALRRLGRAGYALVVITNQSAIGRGMITVEQYGEVDAEMRRQLAEGGVALDGVYYCPEVPGVDDPTVVTHGDRKPAPGMLLRAALELGLDTSSSWMIGDMISDALAGLNAGCKGSLLVRTGKQLDDQARAGASYPAVDDLAAAADFILGSVDGPTTNQGGKTS